MVKYKGVLCALDEMGGGAVGGWMEAASHGGGFAVGFACPICIHILCECVCVNTLRMQSEVVGGLKQTGDHMFVQIYYTTRTTNYTLCCEFGGIQIMRICSVKIHQ